MKCTDCGGSGKMWTCNDPTHDTSYNAREKGFGYKCWLGHFLIEYPCHCQGTGSMPRLGVEEECKHACKLHGIITERELSCEHSKTCEWGTSTRALTESEIEELCENYSIIGAQHGAGEIKPDDIIGHVLHGGKITFHGNPVVIMEEE